MVNVLCRTVLYLSSVYAVGNIVMTFTAFPPPCWQVNFASYLSAAHAQLEEEDFAYTARSVAWELFSTLSRQGLNPIKLAYSPSPPDNGLGQYVSSPGNRAYCYAELAVSSLARAVIIASAHFAYPRRDGQAELALEAC